MTEAVLEKLVVKFDGDARGLIQSAKNVNREINTVSNTATAFKNHFGRVIAGAVAGFTVAKLVGDFRQVVNEMDEIGKAGQRLGVGTEGLSKLKYAASLADVEFGSLEQSIRFMQRSMIEASSNISGDVAAAFRRLGLSVNELINLDPDQAFAAIADGFQKIQNPAERSAIAIQLFGRAGAGMINVMKDGSEGLKELYREAEKAGVVLEDKTAAAAEKLNDDVTRLDAQWKGFMYSMAESGAIDSATALIGNLSNAMQQLGNVIQTVSGFWNEFLQSMSFNAGKAPASALEGLDERKAGVVQGLYKDLSEAEKKLDKMQNGGDDIISAMGGNRGTEEEIKKQRAVIAGIHAEIAAKTSLYNIDQQITAPAKSNSGKSSPYVPVDKNAASEASKVFDKMKNSATSFYEESLDDAEKVRLKMEELDEAYKSGAFNAVYGSEGESAYKKALEYQEQMLEEAIRSADTLENKMRDIGNEITSGIGDGMVDSMNRGNSAGQALIETIKNRVIKAGADIAAAFIEYGAKNLIGSVFGSGGGGGSSKGGGLGDMIGDSLKSFKFFADGGDIKSGQGGFVGDGGLEFFKPKTDGTIIPNNQLGSMGGGGVTVNNVNQINATDGRFVDQRVMAAIPHVVDMTTQAVIKAINSGGKASQSVGRRV